MEWYWIALIIYGIITLLISFVVLDNAPNLEQALDDSLNPIAIYREYEVNVFGCIVLTILGHLIIPWIALFYWFYKLCTVGRR